MDEIIEQFLGNDPILGEYAKQELIRNGEPSLKLIMDRFKTRNRSIQFNLRLAELFGAFPNPPVKELLDFIQNGSWDQKINAAICFDKLKDDRIAYQLIEILNETHDYDVKRAAIDAFGRLGSLNNSFIIRDLLRKHKGYEWVGPSNEGYDWEKLSGFVFLALFRILKKQNSNDDVHRAMGDIEIFYDIATDVGFKSLWNSSKIEIEEMFSDLKPATADAITNYWLNNSNPVFQRLAVKALGHMKLKRTVNVLFKYAIIYKQDEEIVGEIAFALAQIQSKEAALAVKSIFLSFNENSQYYDSICLCLSFCLDRLDEPKYVEEIYPFLLNKGSEIAAHTYYNLALLGFDERVFSDGINAGDYIVRGAIALAYARRQGALSIPKIVEMEHESSREIELLLILTASIIAGRQGRREEMRQILISIQSSMVLRLIRYSWVREIIIALGQVEDARDIKVWEKLFGLNADTAVAELLPFIKKTNITPPTLQLSEAQNPKPIKIFISYAHVNAKIKDPLVDTYLPAIKSLYKDLEIWDDLQIKPGTTWDKIIKNNIRDANIILFLITQSFLGSEYIRNIEMKEAIQRFDKKTQIIVPLYLETVAKELLPFREKQYLPGSKAVSEYHPRHKGWVKIQEGILKLIKDIQEGNTDEYFL